MLPPQFFVLFASSPEKLPWCPLFPSKNTHRHHPLHSFRLSRFSSGGVSQASLAAKRWSAAAWDGGGLALAAGLPNLKSSKVACNSCDRSGSANAMRASERGAFRSWPLGKLGQLSGKLKKCGYLGPGKPMGKKHTHAAIGWE